MIDYAEIYNTWWAQPGNIEHASTASASAVVDRILSSYGCGRILDVGSGTGAVVRELLKRGADAHGIDVSAVTANHCDRYSPGRFSTGSVLALPFADDSFDTVVGINFLEHLDTSDVPQALREIFRVCRRHLFLEISTVPNGRWHRTVRPRAWWENLAFESGFRKHPSYYVVNPFEALERDGNTITIPLEKIPASTLKQYPLAGLLEERALHMDMSRETGARSDAHMARYALAAGWIRPGDFVLDCACGLGYGSAMLAALSKGSRFIGVDLEESAIGYARDNFGQRYQVEYRQGNAEDLSMFPDASFDALISFETLEHVPNFERFLREARRILKPDGRMIVSVPNRWEDETGRDPNPYHHHVFDYAKTRACMEAQGLIMEARYAQCAPGGFKLTDARRSLERLPLQQMEQEADTEWWIVVASADPMAAGSAPYRHPDFERSSTGASFHLTDFARHYRNPWLYRPLVQMGERLDDPDGLHRLSRQVMESLPPDSADYGAALAVAGYRVLGDNPAAPEDTKAVLEQIDGYLAKPNGDPHILRWKISLAFLGARMAMAKGDHREALRYFAAVTESDPCAFSPLLATKTVAAWFWSGVIHLSANHADAARNCFVSGIGAARHALHAPDENAIGNPRDPLTFGFPELAEIADMAGQCANALHHVDEASRSPGKFWQAVNLRRFGLATWATDLQRELKEMRGAQQNMEDLISVAGALGREKSPLARLINKTLAKLFGIRLVRIRLLDRIRLHANKN